MILNKFDLNGKTALVTGAAGLLGKEHVKALLEVGAVVYMTDCNNDSLESAYKEIVSEFSEKKLFHKVMDVTSLDSINNLQKILENNESNLDILINNAAIDPKVRGLNGIVETSRLENFPLDQWDLQISVGLTGSFLCSQVFGSSMAKDCKGGVILNIASDLSVISPDQRIYRNSDLPNEFQPVKPVTYSVIKAGLIGLTRYLSTYWVNEGVRCNALSPGGVYNGQSDEFVAKLSSLIPLGRMAHHEEYRSAVQFLCSDASSYLNGQNIVMDGGRTVW